MSSVSAAWPTANVSGNNVALDADFILNYIADALYETKERLNNTLHITASASEINGYDREAFWHVLNRGQYTAPYKLEMSAAREMNNSSILIIYATLDAVLRSLHTVSRESVTDKTAFADRIDQLYNSPRILNKFLRRIADCRHEYTSDATNNYELLKTLCNQVLFDSYDFPNYLLSRKQYYINTCYASYLKHKPALETEYDIRCIKICSAQLLKDSNIQSDDVVIVMICAGTVDILIAQALAKVGSIGLDISRYGDEYVTDVIQSAFTLAMTSIMTTEENMSVITSKVYDEYLHKHIIDINASEEEDRVAEVHKLIQLMLQ